MTAYAETWSLPDCAAPGKERHGCYRTKEWVFAEMDRLTENMIESAVENRV